MALSAKLDNKDFRVYTLCGDGEIQEAFTVGPKDFLEYH
jgi:transketolase